MKVNFWGLLGGLLMAWPGVAAEELEAVITLIQGRTVRLNVGAQQGAQPGQEFVVVREGKSLGRIRLTEVGERDSSGEIVEETGEPDAPIRLGDRVRGEPAPVPPSTEPVPAEPAQPGKISPQRWRPVRFYEVVSGDDLAYDLLRGLAARGRLPGYTARDFAGESEQLFTRWQIGQILKAALEALATSEALSPQGREGTEGPSLRWDRGSIWSLRTLLPWYRRELEAAGVDYQAAWQNLTARLEAAKTAGESAWFFSGLGEGRLGFGPQGATDGRFVAGLGGALNDRVGAWLTLTNERDDAATRWRPHDTVKRLLATVELSAKDRLVVGRDTLRWGPGYGGSLLLSDHSGPFDLIRYERDRLRILGRSFYFTQFFTIYKEAGHRRWITGRRFATSLSPTTEIAYSEALKMQSAHQVWPSQVLVPIYMAERYPFHIFPELQRPERQSNLLSSVEISSRAGPTATVHFQWLLDDITTNHPVPRKIGWQVGGHWWPGQPGRGLDGRLEYTFIDPGVYEHRQPGAVWSHEGRVMGHPAGPDSQDVYLWVRQELCPEQDVTLVYNWARHGRSRHPTEEQPDQAPERETLWSLSYGRDFTSHLSVGARYLQHRRRNAGQVRGVNRSDERLLIEARYGF